VHLFVQIRLERAQVEVAHGQPHISHGWCNLCRALDGHRAGLVQPQRQRRGDGFIAYRAQSFHIEGELVEA
jgi:hypothetical protein